MWVNIKGNATILGKGIILRRVCEKNCTKKKWRAHKLFWTLIVWWETQIFLKNCPLIYFKDIPEKNIVWRMILSCSKELEKFFKNQKVFEVLNWLTWCQRGKQENVACNPLEEYCTCIAHVQRYLLLSSTASLSQNPLWLWCINLDRENDTAFLCWQLRLKQHSWVHSTKNSDRFSLVIKWEPEKSCPEILPCVRARRSLFYLLVLSFSITE